MIVQLQLQTKSEKHWLSLVSAPHNQHYCSPWLYPAQPLSTDCYQVDSNVKDLAEVGTQLPLNNSHIFLEPPPPPPFPPQTTFTKVSSLYATHMNKTAPITTWTNMAWTAPLPVLSKSRMPDNYCNTLHKIHWHEIIPINAYLHTCTLYHKLRIPSSIIAFTVSIQKCVSASLFFISHEHRSAKKEHYVFAASFLAAAFSTVVITGLCLKTLPADLILSWWPTHHTPSPQQCPRCPALVVTLGSDPPPSLGHADVGTVCVAKPNLQHGYASPLWYSEQEYNAM